MESMAVKASREGVNISSYDNFKKESTIKKTEKTFKIHEGRKNFLM
jgi:hypothetical protein